VPCPRTQQANLPDQKEINLSKIEKRSKKDIAVGDRNSLGASKFSPNILKKMKVFKKRF